MNSRTNPPPSAPSGRRNPRRPRPCAASRLATRIAAALSSLTPLSAAESLWIGPNDGNWGNPAHWQNGIIANGSNATARLRHATAENRIIQLDSPRTLGRLLFETPATWSLTGQPLTLAGPTPEILTEGNATVSAPLLGENGWTKTGPATLTLAAPAIHLGAVKIDSGTLILAHTPFSGPAPLGYWPMNEGAGNTLQNSIPNSPNGSLLQNPAWVEGPGGPGTWAVHFNGTNQYAEITPNTALNQVGTGPLTLSAWVKTTLPGVFYRSLVSKYGTSTITPFWGLGWSAPGELGFVVRNESGSRRQAHTGDEALNGQWHHLVGVREADNTLRIYLNGQRYASTAGPSDKSSNTRPIQIARHLTNHVQATVAGVGIWDQALQADDVAALHLHGWSPASNQPGDPNSHFLLAEQARLELAVSRRIASLNDLTPTGGSLHLGPHHLTLHSDEAASDFSGTLTGSGNLTLSGSAPVTLRGHTILEGELAVEAGQLTLAGNHQHPGRITVRSGASLTLAPSGTLRFTAASFSTANTLQGQGSATFAGTFEIDLSQASTAPGASWLLVNRSSLSQVSFHETSFHVAGFTPSTHTPGLWQRLENNQLWSFLTTTGTLTTETLPEPPTVENLPAVPFQTNSASLRGEITSNSPTPPEVSLFFGPTDGGTDPAAWQSVRLLGPQPNFFSAYIRDLPPQSTVFYRARASNSAGTTWAAESASLTLPATTASSPQVWIHEFMGSTQSTLADEDGHFSDWIELLHLEPNPVDLSGWGLSDNPSSPFKWTFPAGTLLPPNTHLLVWASGKNRRSPPAPLHTSYNIAATGEILTLTRPDGSTADQTPAILAQRDVSYGRRNEDPTRFAFFAQATPAAANTTDPLPERLPAVSLSHPSGIHPAGFDLALSHPDPAATILYTLDGSEPSPAHLGGSTYRFRNSYNSGPLLPQSFTSLTYHGTIPIQDRSSQPNKISLIASTSDSNPSYLPSSPIKKATVVRAKAFARGLESPTSTATYFVSNSNAFQYPYPLVSLAFNEDDLFDYDKGIYVAGVDHVTSSGGRICNWGNFNRTGFEAERPAHFQYFENGTLALDQGVGLRIHGNCSRRNVFKSLRIHADRRYDAPDTLNHPFFDTPVPDATHPANTEFKRIILRSPSINELSFCRLYRPISGIVGGRLRPAIQFLNGEYWGICLIRDRLDDHHLARHYQLDPDNLSVIKIVYGHEVGSSELRAFTLDSGIPSDLDDFHTMRTFISQNNMADPALYQQAANLLDFESYIDHLIFKIFAGDDHYAPEFLFWRARQPENQHFGDGRWRMLVKDFDSTLFTANYVTGLATGSHPRPFGYEIFQSLLANPSFRHAFLNRFADLLNAHFSPQRFQQIIHAAFEEISPHWSEMTARWNQAAFSNPNRPFTTSQRDALLSWSTQHPPRQRLHLRQHFNLAGEFPLTVSSNLPAAGTLRLNSLELSSQTPGISEQPYPWTGTYFHDIPVTLHATAKPGHRFLGWRNPENPDFLTTEPTRTLTANSATSVEALFEPLQPIHHWTFENPESFLSPDTTHGGANLQILPGPSTQTLRNTAAQGFPSAHLRINNPLGSTVQIALPTTGFRDPYLRFLTRRSGQGAAIQQLSQTTNGTDWTAWPPREIADANPAEQTFDFSTFPGAADNPRFAIRITFSQGPGGTTGNNRFDEISLAGTPIPEPSSFAEWRARHFPDPADAANENLSGPFATPRGDGVANLIRYALMLRPDEDAQPFLPSLHDAGNHSWTYRFRHRTDPSGLIWIVRSSPDLRQWQETLFDSRTDPPPPPDAQGWSHLPIPPGQHRRFLRLEIQMP